MVSTSAMWTTAARHTRLVLTTAGATGSCSYVADFRTLRISHCDAAAASSAASLPKQKPADPTRPYGKSTPGSLKTRMTSIGRFSLQSETATNPSLPTFFIGLVGDKPFTSQDFIQRWEERNMKQRHPRFHLRVSETSPGHFEPTECGATNSTTHARPNTDKKRLYLDMHVKDTMFPIVYRTDLKHRLQTCLTDPLHVFQSLWQVQISTGEQLGTSGAISRHKARLAKPQFGNHAVESVLIFRGHHVLGDGVSLGAAFLELTDEADEMNEMIARELKRRRDRQRSLTLWQKLLLYVKRMAWFMNGSVMAFWHQLYLLTVTPQSPFDVIRRLSPETTRYEGMGPPRRSLSWCDATTVHEVKRVARAIGPNVTVNDVWVSCISYAVTRQLEQHRQYIDAIRQDRDVGNKKVIPTRRHINVVIPVHLKGGMLLPGESLGNAIGAFTARVPGESSLSSSGRLEEVHKSLSWVKRTPAPFLSYGLAKVASVLPVALTKRLFASANANACVAITNVRGSPKKLHIGGRSVESSAAFLPLPPNIPIGCAVSSYAGVMALSVTAEPWAVPDADAFLKWTLEEYQRLAAQAGVSNR